MFPKNHGYTETLLLFVSQLYVCFLKVFYVVQCWTGLIRFRQTFGLKYLGLSPQRRQEMSRGHVKISSCVTFANVETLWSIVKNIQWFHTPTGVTGSAAFLLGCNSADIPFTSRHDSQLIHVQSYNLNVTWHVMYKCQCGAYGSYKFEHDRVLQKC